MGTGKTELMRWWRDQNPNARFLNNGHRVNLLKNLSDRLRTAMYSDLGYVGLAQSTSSQHYHRQFVQAKYPSPYLRLHIY